MSARTFLVHEHQIPLSTGKRDRISSETEMNPNEEEEDAVQCETVGIAISALVGRFGTVHSSKIGALMQEIS